jgi:hypothetical protein
MYRDLCRSVAPPTTFEDIGWDESAEHVIKLPSGRGTSQEHSVRDLKDSRCRQVSCER